MTIFLLHQHRYWTEYLDSVLDDEAHFAIIRSRDSADKSFRSRRLATFQPKKHETILCAGRLVDRTHENFIICRCHHSPGFGILPLIFAYGNLVMRDPTSDFRLIVFKEHYKLLSSTKHLDAAHDHFRHQMLGDGRVSTSEIDPVLYQTRLAKRKHLRNKGTGLLAPSWKIATETPEKLGAMIKTLSKELRLSLVLHPMTLHFGDPDFMAKIKPFKEFAKIYFNLPREEMIDLYDQHEFVITDGSGSCYEAILRGCKPLLLDDLSYLRDNKEFHATLEGGYLPFQSYRELPHYRAFDADAFIGETFPFLDRYTYSKAKKILKKEILEACAR